MWLPRTWAEVENALGQLEESSQLDFKRELGKTDDMRSDFASMALEGGVIAYGIDEQSSIVATTITPVPLAGARERIQQISDTSTPPIGVEIILLREHGGDVEGVVIVHIPPSPRAPHMVRDRYPARSGTTTRYLSEREVERFYGQRAALSEPGPGAEPLESFVNPPGKPPLGGGIGGAGTMRILLEPLRPQAYPYGARVETPLRDAVREASQTLAAYVQPLLDSYLLDSLNRWEPYGALGFSAGQMNDDPRILQDSVAASAVYAHKRTSFSIMVRMWLEENGGRCAFEHIWAVEAMAALAVAGSFYRAIPGVSFVRVNLELQGLQGSVSWRSRGRRSDPGQRQVTDSVYSESSVLPVAEMANDPREPVRLLLDRLFASFLEPGYDPVAYVEGVVPT